MFSNAAKPMGPLRNGANEYFISTLFYIFANKIFCVDAKCKFDWRTIDYSIVVCMSMTMSMPCIYQP